MHWLLNVSFLDNNSPVFTHTLDVTTHANTETDYSEFRVKKTEIPATPQTKQHSD